MELKTSVNVSVSAEAAWQVIGLQFGEFGQWVSALESTSLQGELGVGAIRSCRTNGFGPFPASVAEEELIEFDAERRRYTYVVSNGLPGIFKSAQNSWSVEAIDSENSVIHSHAVLELSLFLRPFGFLLKLLFRRDMEKLFAEIAFYVEQGEIHQRKIKSNAELLKT